MPIGPKKDRLKCGICGYKRVWGGSTSSLCLPCNVSIQGDDMISEEGKRIIAEIEQIKDK